MYPYRNFVLMIAVSATLMFGLMHLNTYQPGPMWFSQTRLFMTFLMVGAGLMCTQIERRTLPLTGRFAPARLV